MFKVGNTNRQVAQDIRQRVSDKGPISQSNSITMRTVLFNLLRFRARLLAERLMSKKYISKFNYQTIPCIRLEETDVVECPCAPASGCTFLKACTPIPVHIGNLKSVTSVDGGITYTYVDWDKFKYKLKSRMSSNKTTAYYTYKTGVEGTFLYVYNDVHKKAITPTGIFENPIDVQLYPSCDGTVDNCTRPLDLEFIMDPDLYTLAAEMVLRKVFGLQITSKDMFNNSEDDLTENQIPNRNK